MAETLRSTRESQQMSLEDVRSALGIPRHYLEAMEGGRATLIADEIYLVPFLRRYADHLDLDGASIVAQFLHESGRAARASARRPLPISERPRLAWIVALGLLGLLALAAGWLAWSSLVRHATGGGAGETVGSVAPGT